MISTAPSAQVGDAVNPGVHLGGALNAGAAVRGAITPGVLGASGASNTASATTSGSNGSYSTTFPLTEDPISEGGSWTNGGATGLGWANVQTTPGLSIGTGPVNAGTYYTPIRPQFSKVYGRKTSKYKQPSKFAALTAGPAAKK